jgi:UDP-glucose:(heptosyl)LPS alpha-1,3-glucosyltransferase
LVFLLYSTVLLAVLSLFRKSKFDIVHSTGLDNPLANVMTCHFCEREGRELDESGAAGLPGRTMLQHLRKADLCLDRHLCCFVERVIFRRKTSKLRIAVSERLKEDFVRHYGSAAQTLLVIANGLDTQRFSPSARISCRRQIRARFGIAESDLVLVFVGRHDWERKGLPCVMQALALIPRDDVKLLVVGEGDPALYTDMARGGGVENRVIFVGHTTTIWEYYAAADVFVFPTLYEPYGLVITEAMASGLPVITARAAGAADLIDDGVSGILLDDPTDANELAAKINMLLSDTKLRSDMEREARLAVEGLSWDEVALRNMSAYEIMLSRRRARSSPHGKGVQA